MIAKLQPRQSRRKANDFRIAQKRAKGMSLNKIARSEGVAKGTVFLALERVRRQQALKIIDYDLTKAARKMKATVCSTVFPLLRFSPLSLAQEKPEAPKPKTDRKVFLAGVSLLAANKSVDAFTTSQLLDRGGWESNPLFGPHPSPAKQSLINLGIFGAQAGVFYLTERNRHAWVRWAGRALIGHEILEHSRLAACNAGINV